MNKFTLCTCVSWLVVWLVAVYSDLGFASSAPMFKSHEIADSFEVFGGAEFGQEQIKVDLVVVSKDRIKLVMGTSVSEGDSVSLCRDGVSHRFITVIEAYVIVLNIPVADWNFDQIYCVVLRFGSKAICGPVWIVLAP